MRKPVHSRGFTLVELLVGAAVGAVVLLGISLTFISQAQQYQAHASRRGLQANARLALAFMENHLRVAGYGVDPDRAIIAYDSYNPVADAQEPGYPDAIAVHWRDSLFRRTIQGLNANTLSLPPAAPLNEPLRRGQILMVICTPDPNATDFTVNSNPPHSFVTVGQYVPAGATSIPLDPTPPNAAPNSPQLGPGRLFHEQLVPGFTHACFTNVAKPPQVVLIHRAAFYVAMFDDDGDPATPERTPYLMMHQGLDMPSALSVQGDGTIDADDAVPVAEGIEQLQAAYILNTDDQDPNKAPLIRGVDALMGPTHYGENWEQIEPLGPLGLPTGWVFNSAYPKKPHTTAELIQMRRKDHPANIRQVRLTLVSRSAVPDSQIAGDNLLLRSNGNPYPTGPTVGTANLTAWRQLENLTQGPIAPDFTPSGGHYYRSILRQSVTPKNLLMTRQFAPVNPAGGG
jgi:type IV pilus assembly protein PilW